MKKQTIKLNESQLRNIIKETVSEVFNNQENTNDEFIDTHEVLLYTLVSDLPTAMNILKSGYKPEYQNAGALLYGPGVYGTLNQNNLHRLSKKYGNIVLINKTSRVKTKQTSEGFIAISPFESVMPLAITTVSSLEEMNRIKNTLDY